MFLSFYFNDYFRIKTKTASKPLPLRESCCAQAHVSCKYFANHILLGQKL